MNKKEVYWLNKKNMAASLNISTQAFEKWGVEPIAKIGKEVFFTVETVVANRLEHTNLESLDGDDSEYYIQRTRLTKEQADQIEMKNEITRREQAPVKILEWALANYSTQVVAILESIPSKVKRIEPSLSARSLHLVEREVTKCRNAASKVTLDWGKLEDEELITIDKTLIK